MMTERRHFETAHRALPDLILTCTKTALRFAIAALIASASLSAMLTIATSPTRLTDHGRS
jgi:hypothetical protein